jgi:hypothetical protein
MPALQPRKRLPDAARIARPPQGRDYWLLDDALPDPLAVRARTLARTDWSLGYPHRPGKLAGHARDAGAGSGELGRASRLRAQGHRQRAAVGGRPRRTGAQLNHNCIQVVGRGRMRTAAAHDSRALCRFAAVLYSQSRRAGRIAARVSSATPAGGQRGGNMVMPPHETRSQALGTRFVPPDSFVEDVRMPHRFNRLLVYRANLLHSATAYYGTTLEEKRMAAVFFWMAKA